MEQPCAIPLDIYSSSDNDKCRELRSLCGGENPPLSRINSKTVPGFEAIARAISL